jgi:hypothetical protein
MKNTDFLENLMAAPLSIISEFGLNALEKFEQTENCKVAMDVFHSVLKPSDLDYDYLTKSKNPICFACLGGSAALQLIPQDKWFEIDTTKDLKLFFDKEQNKKIGDLEFCLNYLRAGYVASAISYTNLNNCSDNVFEKAYQNQYLITYYHRDKVQFKLDYQNMITDLRKKETEAGLELEKYLYLLTEEISFDTV